MEFSISSEIPCQLKSVSLRSNEEFIRLYNDVTEARRLYRQRSRVLDDVPDFGLWGLRPSKDQVDHQWQRIQEGIWYIDHLVKRVENCALFSELLPGIMLRFEQHIFPEHKDIRFRFELNLHIPNIFLGSFLKIFLGSFLEALAECVYLGLESAHKVVVLALALLSFMYQYLLGCVDKGGSKTYSPGSFLFRLIFVAIVLFLGSYVWIKSRQTSYTANRRKRKSCPLADHASQFGDESDVPAGVYRRAVKDSTASVTHYKYEPRFKPRREKLESGTSLEFNYLPLGSYDIPGEAEIVRHIAAVLYGKEEGRRVQFEDGLWLPFPAVTEPEKCPPCGKEKADWVTHKTKQLYAELLKEKAGRLQLPHLAVETGSHEANRRDPSPSPAVAHGTAIELTCFTPRHGGNGVVEQATTSESHGLGQALPIDPGVFPDLYSDSDIYQDINRILQLEENGFPALDDLDQFVGDSSEADCIFGSESTLIPPQLRALDNPTSAIVSSVLQLGVEDQGLEIIEPELNSATAITFQQLESLPGQAQLQQRVNCQERRRVEFSGSSVELQQRLLESEERNSELEKRNSELELEMEAWKSLFRQLAKWI